jgi:hypothetical protein
MIARICARAKPASPWSVWRFAFSLKHRICGGRDEVGIHPAEVAHVVEAPGLGHRAPVPV